MAVSSANLHGRPPAPTAAAARDQFGQAVDVYLEAGPLPTDLPSTVVTLVGEAPRVLRPGAIPLRRAAQGGPGAASTGSRALRRARRSTVTSPRPNASNRPHRPGMSSSADASRGSRGSAGSTTRWSPERLQAQHGAQQQQRRAGRPRLRAARRRVLDGVAGQRPVVPAERLGQPALEELRRRPGCPAAIRAASSLYPYRRSPHAMNELSNGHTVPTWYPIGLYRSLALGERAHAPAGEQPRPHQVVAPPTRPGPRRRCRSTAGARCSRTARPPVGPVGRPGPARSTRRRRIQKSRLNRSFSSAASRSSRSA